jgi:2-dehydropantoate 2-reductase
MVTLTDKMSWLVFGAGAIGTYIGGSLALHGHKVVFLEQPTVAEELRKRGLRLDMNGQEHRLKQPLICSSLEEALAQGAFDAAIFAIKSFDTQNALESMRPYIGSLPPLLCLQNGVENEATLAGVLGAEKVIAGTVSSAIGRRAAGDIILERQRGMGVASGNPLSARIARALDESGLNARLYARAADMKWSKMLINLLAGATSAILDMTPAEIFNHPGLYHLETAQLGEAMAVMKAQKIRVVDLPKTPVRALTLAVQLLPDWLSRPLVQRGVGRGRGGKMPSFHIDLHSGRSKSEVDYLNGAVVRAGLRLGIPTPVNKLLNEIVLALVAGEIPLETFSRQPEKLLRKL